MGRRHPPELAKKNRLDAGIKQRAGVLDTTGVHQIARFKDIVLEHVVAGPTKTPARAYALTFGSHSECKAPCERDGSDVKKPETCLFVPPRASGT